jgi:isopentenyl-diphosphate delta-isomerase
MPGRRSSRSTTSRKKEHVGITIHHDVSFRGKTTGLEKLEFVHNALPELNFPEVDSSTSFLGKTLRLPFMVSSMTGGYAEALRINGALAGVCEEMQIALGVGSQRQALEDRKFHRTFSIVREKAPTIPVVGNIGAAEVVALTGDNAKRLVDLVRADALAVHLNPVQEFLQPEGNPNFRGVLAGIERLVRSLPVPVIVKEIGAGISAPVATRLLDAGVACIDVAGAGGTSWAGVEILRRGKEGVRNAFWDWGIPLSVALKDVARLRSVGREFTLIASGGVAGGLDAAKCIALGADLVGAARLFLIELNRSGRPGVKRMLTRWEQELRGAMFLTGSRTLSDLRRVQLVTYPAP